MVAPIWKFRRMHPGEMNIDPIEAEFFSTEALGSLADALVRESIQNSIDARLDHEPVRIRFLFPSPATRVDGEDKEHYLPNLWTHLGASGAGLTKLPSPNEPLDFMVIEDFGTRGLQGNPYQSEDEELDSSGPRNDFYYFWRNIGRSRKHSAELGRWGLGKTVFPAASRINSFFAATVRADDRHKLLMGQSVLKIHKIGAQRFYPYGYFGLFNDEFAVPVSDEGYFDRFCRDFQVARGGRPGLSVVIPFPDPDLAPHTIIPSIIRHYFVPIISGDLMVEVVHHGRSQLLDAGTLTDYLTHASWEDAPQLTKLIDLARWGLTASRDEYARTAPQPESSAPRWADNCLDVDILAQVRERFNAGQRIAVSVPVWVKPASKPSVLSHFDVCLERDDTLSGSEEHFVRDGITIAGVRTSLQKSVLAIVMVRERPLSELLGDSENPSHTEWQERSPKFKDRYRHGPYTLRYVKNAPREIVRALMRPTEGRDFKLLQHLFSLDVPTENAVKDPRKGRQDLPGTEESGGPDGIETVAKDTFFQLQKLNGGFRIVGTGKNPTGLQSVAVWAAYEVRRGNPFRQYQALDFETDKPPIVVHAEGATVLRRQANVLQFRVDRPDFRLTVKGFDLHRDVRVKVLGSDEGSGA